MKIDIRVFTLALVLGSVLLALDFILDNSVFNQLSVLVPIFGETSGSELFMRVLVFVTFLVSGFFLARQLHQKQESERRAAEASMFLQQLINAIPAPVFYKDKSYVYTGCNTSFAAFLGRSAAEITGKTVYELAPAHLAETYQVKDEELMAKPGIQIYESKVRVGTENEADVIFHKATYEDANGNVAGMIGVILDITKLRKAEIEREKLIAELREALDKVKVLSGFLPICATCKKIRNDSGYWQRIDTYIREHSEAVFSHSICPDCSRNLFSEYKAEQQGVAARGAADS